MVTHTNDSISIYIRNIDVLPLPTVFMIDAQTKHAELIHKHNPGEEILITENNQPTVRQQVTPSPPRQPRRPGTLRGTVLYMASDFNAPLDDFKEPDFNTPC